MIYFDDDYIADVRAESPGHFIVERVTANAHCLVLIPNTEANRERILRHFPVTDPEMIDLRTFEWDPQSLNSTQP